MTGPNDHYGLPDPNEYFKSETPEQRRAFVAWLRKGSEDYLWCLSQPEMLQCYHGQVVVLHERKVIGHGVGSAEAKQDALQKARARGEDLPPERDLIYVPIPENPWLDEMMIPPRARRTLSPAPPGRENRSK